MIEVLDDMPEGVLGVRVGGRLTADDYQGLVPTLEEAVNKGDIRIVEVIGPEYEGLEAGAVLADLKVGMEYVFGHFKEWKKVAVVTDISWISHAIHALAWMVPGECEIFGMDQLEEAKAWAAAA